MLKKYVTLPHEFTFKLCFQNDIKIKLTSTYSTICTLLKMFAKCAFEAKRHI